MTDFGDVQVGDRISFLTADNGFGQDGAPVERTGTVTRKTERTVIVACESNRLGGTARLTQGKWRERCVRRD